MWRRRKQRTAWRDLPAGQRRMLMAGATVQIGLLVSGLIDLARRDAAEVRGGRRLLWLPVLFINFIGPILYFLLARKKRDAGEDLEAAMQPAMPAD